MKFVHIADIHFDSPFINLSDRETLGDIRRLDQRKAFKKAITYIKENKIPYLFIAGDLYEHNYIKKSTIQYINNLFEEIPETKIFITPGNHDPYLQNSYYNKFEWSKNVHIFHSQFEKISDENMDIYGYGFDNFYCTDSGIENLTIQDPSKLNILILHGTINGASLEEKQYNSVQKKMLEEKGFDYVAMGHIHKISYQDEPNQRIVYPGSAVSIGFDELGKHGMIVGDISKENLSLEFLPLDEKEFVEKRIDVTDILSKEELIEKINEEPIEANQFAKIILVGKRRFEIDTYALYKLVENMNIIKIKNKTKIFYDLEKMANENTLKGLFAKEMFEKMQQENVTEDEKEIMEKAIEIAFEALT